MDIGKKKDDNVEFMANNTSKENNKDDDNISSEGKKLDPDLKAKLEVIDVDNNNITIRKKEKKKYPVDKYAHLRSQTWVEELKLTMRDKIIISKNDEWLGDEQIQISMALLGKKYQPISGLQSTLLVPSYDAKKKKWSYSIPFRYEIIKSSTGTLHCQISAKLRLRSTHTVLNCTT